MSSERIRKLVNLYLQSLWRWYLKEVRLGGGASWMMILQGIQVTSRACKPELKFKGILHI